MKPKQTLLAREWDEEIKAGVKFQVFFKFPLKGKIKTTQRATIIGKFHDMISELEMRFKELVDAELKIWEQRYK